MWALSECSVCSRIFRPKSWRKDASSPWRPTSTCCCGCGAKKRWQETRKTKTSKSCLFCGNTISISRAGDHSQTSGWKKRKYCGHICYWASLKNVNTKKALIDRFRSCYRKREDGCWQWVGHKGQSSGRRMFYLSQSVAALSYRVSYLIHYGLFDFSLHVRHRCDNPNCVNPEHLLLGTHQDNMRDAVERHRRPAGETHFNAIDRTTAEKAYRLSAGGQSMLAIAKSLGIGWSTVKRIATNEHWSTRA